MIGEPLLRKEMMREDLVNERKRRTGTQQRICRLIRAM